MSGTQNPQGIVTHAVDRKNRITQTAIDSNGALTGGVTNTTYVSDAAGNLVYNGARFFQYDAWNHIAKAFPATAVVVSAAGTITSGPTGNPLAAYEFDALGRKIARTTGANTAPDHFRYYDGHRVLEEYELPRLRKSKPRSM